MQIVRTVVWVLLLVALLIFSVANWEPAVTVNIWENLVVETKIPAIVIVSFLIGFVPMWLLQRGMKWHYRRRISSLENAVRVASETPAPSPVPATSAAVTAPATSAAAADDAVYPDPLPGEEREDLFLRDRDLPPSSDNSRP